MQAPWQNETAMIYRGIIEGARMKFCVLRRAEAASVTHDEPYIVISITDTEAREAALVDSPLRLGVLRLKCLDAEPPRTRSFFITTFRTATCIDWFWKQPSGVSDIAA